MSPRRSRRARRRSTLRSVVVIVAAAVVLALVVGGLARVSSQSAGYRAGSARTLAAQGRVLADQSNATSTSVRRLMKGLPGQTRQSLQSALDSAVQETATQSARAALASSSTPLGSVSADFADVFAERARSMEKLRAAFDGFLGMQPLPVAGAPASTSPSASASATLLSATQATNRIAAAGALLVRSDRLYQSVRRALAAGAGHGRLPPSVWVTDPAQWRPGVVTTAVDRVATSPTLASAHDVVLRTVRLTPPPLPTPQGAAAGIGVLSPVSRLGVTAVLANQGSVAETGVQVHFRLADQTSGATTTHSEAAALGLGASVTLPTVTFKVKPGRIYVLTVKVARPAGQTLTDGTVYQQGLQVAPAS